MAVVGSSLNNMCHYRFAEPDQFFLELQSLCRANEFVGGSLKYQHRGFQFAE